MFTLWSEGHIIRGTVGACKIVMAVHGIWTIAERFDRVDDELLRHELTDMSALDPAITRS